MINSKSKITGVVLNALLVIVMLFGMGPSAIAAPPSDGPYLFTESDIAGSLDTTGDPTIVRTRFVNVNFDLLDGADSPDEEDQSAISNILVLNLFNDVVLTAALDRVEPNRSGGYSWIGHLEGMEYSQVILVVEDGLMAGNIALPGAFYQVRYAGGGVHAIYEVNQAAFPPESEPIPVAIPGEDPAEAWDIVAADDGSIIDVLVVYTPAARSSAGGTTAMQSLINLAVTETNTGYGNSNVTQRLNLVHSEEVSYTESGDMSTDLTRLQGTSDGHMDNVHTLRDTYCADEVVLIVDNISGYPCGIAYMMDPVSSLFESYAFAVVARNCATGYYSFGHELGHNMAARHDCYVDSSTTPYVYAHGYVYTPAIWRTIMAYNTECNDSGFYCPRLNYWSNPGVTYGGIPMGTSTGTCQADNHSTLDNTASTVANFRQSCCNDPHEPNDTWGQATPIAYGDTLTDPDICPAGDVDYYAFTGSAGDTVVADIDAWAIGSSLDSYLYLYDTDGVTELTHNDDYDGSLDSHIEYTLSANGTYYLKVQDYGTPDGGPDYFYTISLINVGPLEYDSYTVDDDNSDESSGNDDGIADPGETVELYVDLYNQGSDTAIGVNATISTTDSYVTFLFNTSSSYPDIPGGGTGTNGDDFDFDMDPSTPVGHVIPFTLTITASNGGPWSDSFDVTVGEAPEEDIYLPIIQKNH